jgi:glutathione S-transferase
MEPVLFYGVPQGCSFGSIVALEWLGQPYRLCRIEMLEHPWPALYARINPLNQTPALLTQEGAPLSESLAILLHEAARGQGRGLGFAQGTPAFDDLNQMLAFLNTDFFSAFSPLWTAYEMAKSDPVAQKVLTTLGAGQVRKRFADLDSMLAGRDWLVGGQRTVADAYLSGIARWAGYHKLFNVDSDYPRVGELLRRLKDDPALKFAEAIEKGGPAATSGQFLGHVTLEELRPRLEAAR